MENKPCDKVSFPSRKAAKKAMKKINHNHLIDYVLTDVYFCEQCQSWHHTSKPKKEARQYRRYLKNKKRRP